MSQNPEKESPPMDQDKKQQIEFEDNVKQEFGVQPGGELEISGVDFEDVAVDIVDTDVVLTDPGTGAQIILLGLAIFLFDEEEVPLVTINGMLVEPHVLLSKVGEIGNLTQQEFVAVSSLLEEDFKDSEIEQEEADKEFDAAAAILAMITDAVESASQAQEAVAEKVEISKDDAKFDKKLIDEEGDKYSVAPKAPPPATPSLAAAAEAPPVPQAEALFELLLLQPTKVEVISEDDVENRTILGGGGSEESAFNPSNDAQFSTEVLNYGARTEDLVIMTDNPDYFDANMMTRVIELTPTFPTGFIVTDISLSGFPSGFEIEGATQVGNSYTIENPEFNDRGSLRLNLIYQVPSSETFSVDFVVKAEFDTTAVDEDGVPVVPPPEPIIESALTREFEMRDVTSAEELNYVNAEGEEVWVLANDPNPNRVFSGSGDDQITGSVAIDFIQGGDGVDIIDGGAGDDVLNGEGGDDIILHSEGKDRIVGGTGSDTVDYSDQVVDIVADLSTIVDGYANVVIGDPEDEEIDELTTVENIRTGSGADTLVGDSEDNHLFGGSGTDTLVGGWGNDILDGGDDRDIADYSGSANPIVTNLTLEEDNVFIDDSNIDTLLNIEHVIGSEFDDIMEGGAADETFWAGAGDDTLIGGEGSNTLDGGEGDGDIVDFSGSASGVKVNFGAGTDGEGYVIATHGSDADRIKNIEDLIGSDHDDELRGDDADQTIIGREGSDIIDGAGGDDLLDGGLGTDQIIGGSGDDTFVHSDGNDSIDGGDDSDTVDFSLTEAITEVNAVLDGANNSAIAVTGGDDLTVKNVENIIGTPGNDSLQGDASDNILDGRDGDDILIGAAGNDTLIGGEGRDSADYSVATVGVDIDISTGVVANDGFGGTDTIEGVEDVTGSDYDDILSGDDQDNVLSGGTGDDVLLGRGGDDLLSGGEGQDAASYEFAAAPVYVDLGADEPTQDGDGGEDTFDSIESAIGSAFNDTLIGDELANTLSGLDGNDVLDGNGGDDELLGGAGDDRLLASAGSDIFDGQEGNDSLDYSEFADASSINVTLAGDEYAEVTVTGSDNDQVKNVETIVATSGNDVLGGDTNANTLMGEAGDDVIRGGGGSDILVGGDGVDQLRFDDLDADGIILSLETSTASYADDGSVDSFSEFELYATTNQDDLVYTSSNVDYVEGLAGDDHFLGSSGSDELFGGDGSDLVDYSSMGDIDHIEATLDEGNTVTVTVVGGDDDQITSIESITGSAGDDIIIGDSFDNMFSGAAGNDLLDGAGGDDHLFGDSGDDSFVSGTGDDIFDGGDGRDVIDYSGSPSGISVDMTVNTAFNDGHGDQDTLREVENIIGTSDSDIIVGDGEINEIYAGDGDDIIRGGLGSDTLDAGAGTRDEVHFDDLTAAGVTLDIEQGTAFYSADASTDDLLGFESYYTTGQDDIIRGSKGADEVYASTGEDTFEASLGEDVLHGGADLDTIDYADLTEANSISVTLDGDTPVDVIVDGVGTQNITSIENVTGTSGDDLLGGDASVNVLIAGDGNDTVFGGAGSDILRGGEGTDELRFDELGAVGISLNIERGIANYSPDDSTDTFSGFERYRTTDQDDDIELSIASDHVLALDGDDFIEASLGADTVDGGSGADTIDYSSSDLVGVTHIEVELSNNDEVTVVVNGADDDTISNIENVTGTAGDDVITGDGQINILEGMGGADRLSGGEGDDELIGGVGDDVLLGGDGNDILSGQQGRDTASYLDAAGGVNANLAAGVASNDGYGGTDTLTSIENIEGSTFGDILKGDDSLNVIVGGDGDDVVYGGKGSDTLSGDAHIDGDVLRFDDLTEAGVRLDLSSGEAAYIADDSTDKFSGFESYYGTNQGDELIGSPVADDVNTLGGDDLLNASAGSDILDGGLGSDTMDYSSLTGVSSISVTLDETTPVTVNVAGGDDDTIVNVENVIGSSGDDYFGGDTSDNRFEGRDGDDEFIASAGADVMFGGVGMDTVDYSGFASAGFIDVTLLGDSQSTVSVAGSDNDVISGIENVVGTSGDDIIVGDDQANVLEGDGGDDTLDGGAGDDLILGGTGDDIVLASEGADTSEGGAGIDTIDYSDLPTGQSIEVTLLESADATVTIAGGMNQTVRGIENVIGTNSDDTISGDALSNHISAQGGDDVIGASAGVDTLDGGDGNDTADYSVLAGIQRINVTLDEGNLSPVQVTGGANDQVANIENIIATDGNDTLIGDGQDNRLEGRLGGDTLVGGAGNDILDGGDDAFADLVSYADSSSGIVADLSSGNVSDDGFGDTDTLIDIEELRGSEFKDDIIVDTSTQKIEALGGDDDITMTLGEINVHGGLGSDTVDYSSLDAANAIDVELDGLNAVTLTVTGSTVHTLTSIENVIGTPGNDILTGDGSDNRLEGGLGDDILQGRDGDDELIGGEGDDKADYSKAGGAVDVDLANNIAINDGDGGSDTLSGIEHLAGSNFDDVIAGNDSDNILEGNAGADSIKGGAGQDTIDGGTGRDTADYTDAAGVVSVDLDAGVASQDGDGSADTLLSIEDVIGSGQDDLLYGDDNDNELVGGAGNDTLRGGGGFDALVGGSGTGDTADYSQASSQIVVNLTSSSTSNDGDGSFDTLSEGGEGADTLIGAGSNDYLDGGDGLSDTVDYSAAPDDVNVDLAAGVASADGYQSNDTVVNIENVVGSNNDDTIAGSDEANTLDGLGGNDLLIASAGNDEFDGGAGSDTLDYSGLAGATGISADLNGASTITVTVTGGDNDTVSNVENLIGTSGDDVLGGDTNINRLEGLEGDDSFTASAGADLIIGGAGDDTLDYSTFASAQDISVTLQDTADSTVVVTGSDNDTISGIENIVGTAGADTLTGNSLANTLEGRAGDDTLSGGAGDDILLGGTGTDILIASEGADLADGGAGQDSIDFSGLATGQSIDVTLDGAVDSVVTVNNGSDQTVRNIENVIGTGDSDQITGDNLAKVLIPWITLT